MSSWDGNQSEGPLGQPTSWPAKDPCATWQQLFDVPGTVLVSPGPCPSRGVPWKLAGNQSLRRQVTSEPGSAGSPWAPSVGGCRCPHLPLNAKADRSMDFALGTSPVACCCVSWVLRPGKVQGDALGLWERDYFPASIPFPWPSL